MLFKNDRSVPSHRYIKRDRVSFGTRESLANLDLLMTHFRVAPTLRREVAKRIRRIELFDVGIRDVRADIGHAPGDSIVVTYDHSGHTGRGDARDADARCAQMYEIPDRRRRCRQVWIAREQRLAGLGALAADNPVVARGQTFSVETNSLEGLRCNFLVLCQRPVQIR